MAKETKPTGKPTVEETSELGRRLREISDRAIASGVKVLSRDEINRMVRAARGGLKTQNA